MQQQMLRQQAAAMRQQQQQQFLSKTGSMPNGQRNMMMGSPVTSSTIDPQTMLRSQNMMAQQQQLRQQQQMMASMGLSMAGNNDVLNGFSQSPNMDTMSPNMTSTPTSTATSQAMNPNDVLTNAMMNQNIMMNPNMMMYGGEDNNYNVMAMMQRMQQQKDFDDTF
jgi:hypothetical protein